MDETLRRFLDLTAGDWEYCKLYHEREGLKGESPNTVKGEGYSASLLGGDPASATISISVAGYKLPPEWYIELPKALCESGTHKIELETWGWWLGRDPCPERVRITDHVGCYLASPLTGSDAARRGEAFVSLKGAYGVGEGTDVARAILWHTEETLQLSATEVEAAKKGGCTVASRVVAPWAIGAKSGGCEFAALIRFPHKLKREA